MERLLQMFSLAVTSGRSSIVEAILLESDFDKTEALMLLAKTGDERAMKALVSRLTNTQINARDEGGQTALMLASKNGWAETVIILLEAGANPTLHDRVGNTAAFLAAYFGHMEICVRLIEALRCAPSVAVTSTYPINIKSITVDDADKLTTFSQDLWGYERNRALQTFIELWGYRKRLLPIGKSLRYEQLRSNSGVMLRGSPNT